MDDYIYYIVSLTINGLTSLYFSVQYCAVKKLLVTFLESYTVGINNAEKIDDESESTFVVVRGKVKSVGPAIKSLHKPFTSGVIQKLITKEFLSEKSQFGIWVNDERVIDEKCNVIPFELKQGKFKIAVTSPLEARFLDLEVMDNHFEPAVSSLLGLLFGVQQKGIQYTEYLLKESAVLTGFGEIIKGKDGSFQLIPPKNGLRYILTPMDPETLIKKLLEEKKFYGVCCAIFSVVGITIACALSYKLWKATKSKKREQEAEALVRRAREEREGKVTNIEPLNESFTCIICFVQPREVVLLPCGHVSMCADCAYKNINRPCPICRKKVANMNLIYIS